MQVSAKHGDKSLAAAAQCRTLGMIGVGVDS